MVITKIREGYQSIDNFVSKLGDKIPTRLHFDLDFKRLTKKQFTEKVKTIKKVFKKHKPSIVIKDHIGSGGFADVFYAVSDYDGNHDFAIKILKNELLQIRRKKGFRIHEEEMRIKEVKQRFKNESYVQWDLSKSVSESVADSVVKVYDHGEFDSKNEFRFILMERMESTLRDFINNKDNFRNTQNQLRYKTLLLTKIADRIENVHREGIFHRDIKPENILFPRHPQPGFGDERRLDVKLGDFGTVRWVKSYTNKYDAVIIGSQCYMSPEQIFNPRRLDQRTDIYSFGVVAYEMIFGSHPKDLDPNTKDLLEKLVKFKPIKRPAPPHFEGLLSIIYKCMQDKYRRYQTMSDVVSDLHAFIDSLPDFSDN